MRILTACVSAAFFAGSWLQAFSVDVVPNLPAETKVVIKVDCAQWHASKVFELLQANAGEKIAQMRDKFLDKTGVSPDDISTVIVAGVEKHRGIVVLSGDFNVDAVVEKVSALPKVEVQKRAGVEFAAMLPKKKGKGTNLAVILDDSTIVFGDSDLVDQFLVAVNGGGDTITEEQAAKVAAGLANGHTVQAVLLGVPKGGAHMPFASGVVSGAFSADVSDSLAINADFTMKSPKIAESMRNMIQGIIGFASCPKRGGAPSRGALISALLKNMEVKCDGAKISANTVVNAETIKKLIESAVEKAAASEVKERPVKK